MILGHSQQSLLLGTARLVERAGYYGVRAMIVIFAINALGFVREEALGLYGNMTTLTYFAMFIGGLISDLTRGNKWVALASGILEIAGILCFITQDINMLLIGGVLFGIGSGGFVSANLSAFARANFGNIRNLQSVWTIYYALINAGAFFGIWYSNIQVAEGGPLNYNNVLYGAIVVIASGTAITFFNTPDFPQVKRKKSAHPGRDITLIVLTVAITSLFWFCIESFGSQIALWSYQAVSDSPNPNWAFNLDFNAYTTMIGGLLLALLFLAVRTRAIRLLSIAFLIAAAGFTIFNIAPNFDNNLYELIVIHSIILSLAETIVIPAMLSIQTQHSNPRYLGTIMGGCLLGVSLLSKFVFFNITFDLNKIPWNGLTIILAVILLLVSVVWFVLQFFLKDRFSFEHVDANREEGLKLKEDEILD